MSTCYADPNPDFTPAMRLITAISNGYPAVVTTTFAHGYITGTIVRLIIPDACMMTEANQLTGTITVTGPTTFNIDINTNLFTPFIVPAPVNPHINTCAMIIPIGEVNSQLTAAIVNS